MEYEVRVRSAVDLGLLLAERSRLAAAKQQQQQEPCSDPATYQGYDADTGLHKIEVDGQIITRSRGITTGGFSIGQPIDSLCTSVVGGLPFIEPVEQEEEELITSYNFLIGYYLEPDLKTFLGGDRSAASIFDGTTAQLQVAAFGSRRAWGAIDAEQLRLNGNVSTPSGNDGEGSFIGHCCSFWSRLDGTETSSGTETRIDYSYYPKLIDSLGNEYNGSGSGFVATSDVTSGTDTTSTENSSFTFSVPILPAESLSSSGSRDYLFTGSLTAQSVSLSESSTVRSILLVDSTLTKAIAAQQSHTYTGSATGDGSTWEPSTETYTTSNTILFIGDETDLDDTPALVTELGSWDPVTGSFSAEVATGSYATGGSNAGGDVGEPNEFSYNTRLAIALSGMPVVVAKRKVPGGVECWKGFGAIASVSAGSTASSRNVSISITEVVEAPFDSIFVANPLADIVLYSESGSVYELIGHCVPGAIEAGELPQSRRTVLLNGLGNANPGQVNYHWKGNKVYIANNQVSDIGDRISKNYADVFTLTGNRFVKSRQPVSGFQQRLKTAQQTITGTPSAFYIP